MFTRLLTILLLLIPRILCSCSVRESCPLVNDSLWWKLLKFKDGKDPCQLAKDMCHDPTDGQGTPEAHSCTVPNILAACIACTLFPNQTHPPSAAQLKEAANTSLRHILSRSANCSVSRLSPLTHNSPHWAHIPYAPQFDPREAVRAATPPAFFIPQSSHTIMNASQPQPTPSTSTSIPSDPTPKTSPPKMTTSNAGAIAGGVVGGVLFLSLLTIGLLYFRRRRNQHRVAPSAEFMFLAGSGASYSRTLNDSPPPEYIMRNSPDPVLEKAYRSAEAQRRLDSNDSSVAAWEHPV